MIALGELKVPRGLRPVVEEIVGITDSVCLSVLDEQYADLARRAVAKLARKRPSPLQAGRRATWAAGVVYALGHVNFLSDPASQPCVTADQLSTAFGVAKSTMSSKARQVRDLLRMSHFSPEFQRADVAAQNPLAWIIEVNGLAVDARHVPPGIQAEAFQRGLIPYMPALGPDETAARATSQVTGTPPVASAATEVFPYAGGRLASLRRDAVAGAAAPSEAAGLLDHCSDLKRQLVEFARSRRFSRQFDQALRAGSRGKAVDESEFINIIDHFILQRPLPGERTVVETFVSAHPELAEADRQMLLGWRDVVEGVFEIRERDGEAIIAVNLIDELTYRVYSNAGPAVLASMEPGCFMIARIVPIEFFGSDLIVVPGPEVASRMNGFLTLYTRRVLEEAGSAASSLDAEVAARTPAFSVPGDLASAPSVALAYDEVACRSRRGSSRSVVKPESPPCWNTSRSSP